MFNWMLFTRVEFNLHDLTVACYTPTALGRAVGKQTHWTVAICKNPKWAPWSLNGNYIGNTPVILNKLAVLNGALMSYTLTPVGWNNNIKVTMNLSDPLPITSNCTLFTNGGCTNWSEQQEDHGTMEIPVATVS